MYNDFFTDQESILNRNLKPPEEYSNLNILSLKITPSGGGKVHCCKFKTSWY